MLPEPRAAFLKDGAIAFNADAVNATDLRSYSRVDIRYEKPQRRIAFSYHNDPSRGQAVSSARKGARILSKRFLQENGLTHLAGKRYAVIPYPANGIDAGIKLEPTEGWLRGN